MQVLKCLRNERGVWGVWTCSDGTTELCPFVLVFSFRVHVHSRSLACAEGAKTHTRFKEAKLCVKIVTLSILIAEDERKSRLTPADTRGAQSGDPQRPETHR